MATGSQLSKQSKQQKQLPPGTPSTSPVKLVKYDQAILPDSFAARISDPQIAIHKTHAVLTSDSHVHFYTLSKNKWMPTTTVSLLNTHRLSVALSHGMAVIGVPYDRNSKGLLTGSVYIFECDPKTQTWYQVKKIVPKRAGEYATVGYSVDICDNVVVVGVPELGTNGTAGGGGSVYAYQRVEPFKWVPMGYLTDDSTDASLADPSNGLLPSTASKFGTIVALRAGILVVSNYWPNKYFEETSLFVYEYDPSHKNMWNLIQTDLLTTEGQRRHFGSHVALTTDGEGIFIGCHSKVNPTEILFYRRNGRADMHGNRSFRLQQIITLQERCDIGNFKVDEGNGNFILGTLDSNHVYVYQRMHHLITMEDQGWRRMCKVAHGGGSGVSSGHSQEIDQFGANVGLYGDNVLVGSKNNVYSYRLERWRTNKKDSKKMVKSSSRNLFMRAVSPMSFRRPS